jgi:hypothetical protein
VRFEKAIFKNYQNSAKEVACYLKLKLYPPKDIEDRHKYNLNMLRAHLDSLNIRMPVPLYPYDKNDEGTQKWIMKEEGDAKGFKKMLNENYIYKNAWRPNTSTVEL